MAQLLSAPAPVVASMLALGGCDLVFGVAIPTDASMDAMHDASTDTLDASPVCVTEPMILRPATVRTALWQAMPSTGSHVDHVSEQVADDDASYITSQSDGQFTTFTHAGRIPASVTIDSVTIWIRAREETEVEIPQVAPALDANPALVWDDLHIGTSWGDYSGRRLAQNPTTMQPWTVDELDAIAFGVRKTYATARVRVTQIWAVVECH